MDYRKYVQFAVLVLICVVVDQWTKQIASDRLATTHSWIDHPIVLAVPQTLDGKTALDVLSAEFTRNTEDEVAEIAHRYLLDETGQRLPADATVSAGDNLTVTNRKIVVVPGYFDLEYTRNEGAAFGFLADADSPWRIPFFVTVSAIALIVILSMVRGVERNDHLSIFALSFIAGGAIGNNLLDRPMYGWVIDFIVWKVGDEYRWPTFNMADSFICVGVALLFIQMWRDSRAERREKANAKPELAENPPTQPEPDT